MVPSRADPSEPLSIPSRSSPDPRPSSPIPTSVVLVTVLLACQISLCAADTSNDDRGSVTWTFPRGGEVFHQRDTVNVTYQSSYAQPWLYIWCYENETANTVRPVRKQQVEPYNASVLISMDFDTSTPCWFNLRDSTKSTNVGRNTEKWSLRQNERKSGAITTGAALPSTTAGSSTATSTSASTSAAAAAESDTTTTAAAAAKASSGNDISPGAKAGLGIGVGIATSLLCAGAFWLYYRHVKRKEHHQEVYRRIVGSGQGGPGGGGGGAGPGPSHDAHATPNNNYSEHLEPWRHGGTPQPAPSAWSGASDPSTTDWYAGGGGGHHHHQTANAPYQYYDPVGSSHQLGAMAGAAGATYHQYAQHQYQYQHPRPSVTTTASMTAEPAPSTIPIPRPQPIQTDHVPDAAAIRDVQDLSSTLFPSEYNNEPVSPVSATAAPAADRSSIPPARLASVNYGPNGPRDASTGADFTLLPGYTAPVAGGQEGLEEEQDDIYGPPTPRSPPPPHSAHAHIVAPGLTAQGQGTTRLEPAWQQPHSGGGDVVELPTAQTHRRGYGPQAELPADEVGTQQQQQPLRQQGSGLRGPEQKVLLRDVAVLRRGVGNGG